jgi:hypothetical protein
MRTLAPMGDDRLLYETRVRMRQAVLAALAAVLLIVAAVIQLVGPHTKINELTLDLIYAHKRFPLDLIGAVINAGGLIVLGGTLSWLFGAAQARNPQLKPFVRALAWTGGVIAAISGIAYASVIAVKAHDFITHGSQTYQQANDLTHGAVLVALPFVGQAASLLLAIGFVLTALNAMRVGLLTRFMGYLGMFAGVLVLFPIGSPVPVVQGFWLFALAYLLSGRWPTGVPPAWRTGRWEPWPPSATLRQQRDGAGVLGRRPKPAPAPAPEPVGAPVSARTRSGTPKRKRKRRG